VSLVTAPFAGRLYWLATRQDGTVTRLDAEGSIAPVSETDLAEAARRIAGDAEIAEQALIAEEDAYYFREGERFVLPVYRVVLRDDESTRYYVDPRSGAIVERADATARWYRWLFGGLHRIDFTAWMRARPAWDVIMSKISPYDRGCWLFCTEPFWFRLRRLILGVLGDTTMLFDPARPDWRRRSPPMASRQAHVVWTVSSHLTDGHGLWISLRRTSIWCPHDQALSRSKTAMLPGGSPARPKLRESR